LPCWSVADLGVTDLGVAALTAAALTAAALTAADFAAFFSIFSAAFKEDFFGFDCKLNTGEFLVVLGVCARLEVFLFTFGIIENIALAFATFFLPSSVRIICLILFASPCVLYAPSLVAVKFGASDSTTFLKEAIYIYIKKIKTIY